MRAGVALAVLVAGHQITFGQTTAPAPASSRPDPIGAPLGSLDFKPTPERPVGWRGDWTGRFPGATPPMEWNRRVKGITTEIKYQAVKPSGEPGSDSFPLEYFTLKEWLVAGPYAAEDSAQNIEKDFLGGEEKVEPDGNARAGDSTWKPLRVGTGTQSRHYHNEGTCGDLNVDFVYVFGNLPESGAAKSLEVPLDNKVAYAHTYFHSPSAGQVMLRINYSAAAIKVFVNGQTVAIKRGEPVKITIAKGWNRLLVKLASGEATAPEGQNPWVSRWRFAACLEPVLPVSYETKNIAWMTKMTGRSMSQPIVVGDRLYVGSGMTDLLCLDKRSGKILWLRSNTPYDAMTAEERAAIPQMHEQIEPLAARLNALNDEAVKAINAAVSPAGLSSPQQVELDKTLKAKTDAERAVHDAFAAINRKKYPQMYKNEVSSSNASPLSDGEHVYWVCGGGMKGPGSHVVACFDLNGRRVWSRHDGGTLGSQEHGSHISPNLVDGKLIYAANTTLLAFDAKTGEELWRNSPDDWQNGLGSVAPVVVMIGGTNAILSNRFLHRAADGTVICPSRLDIWGVFTPIVENNIMYNPCHWRGFKNVLSRLYPSSEVDRVHADLLKAGLTGTVRAEEFVASRRDDWNHLENLIATGSAGRLNPLQPMQVLTLASLYRRATADLARAQRDWPDEPVHRYLNGLVARGHGVVYRRGGNVWTRIRTFYTQTLPQTYRAAWPYVVASAALLFVPALVAFFVVLANPDAAYGIASPGLIDRVHHHQLWTKIALGVGEISQVHLAQRIGSMPLLATIKLSSAPTAAAHYAREAQVVRELQALDEAGAGAYFSKLLPEVIAQGVVDSASGKQGLVLRHPTGFWGSLAALQTPWAVESLYRHYGLERALLQTFAQTQVVYYGLCAAVLFRNHRRDNRNDYPVAS